MYKKSNNNLAVYEIKTYGSNKKRVIFLLGGWGIKQWVLWPVSKMLEAAGFYCITYTFNPEILTPDIDQTVLHVLKIKQLIMESIQTFSELGYEEFSIFGTSLGSVVGLLVANESSQIHKVIFNIPGMDMAESMWGWDKLFPDFKQELVNRYGDFETFKSAIAPINPTGHIDNLGDKDLLVYVSLNDEVTQSKASEFGQKLLMAHYKFQLLINNRFGHTGTGLFNLFNAPVYLRFLNSIAT